jgi:hypothetical protein
MYRPIPACTRSFGGISGGSFSLRAIAILTALLMTECAGPQTVGDDPLLCGRKAHTFLAIARVSRTGLDRCSAVMMG